MPQPEKTKAGSRLSKSLDANEQRIKKDFAGADTLVVRRFENRHNPAVKCCIFFTDGMINNFLINDNIVWPVTSFDANVTTSCVVDYLLEKVLQINEAKKTTDFDEIEEGIVYGDTVLFAEGCDEALILNTKGFPVRGISEPSTEKVLEGPREGFTEALLPNLSMLRRKLKTPDLNFKYRTFGTETKTKACVCWIGRLAKPEVLEELNRRLDQFDLDSLLDANYLLEYLKEPKLSPFKSYGTTERPDIIAAKLLEGRVAVFVDGTPTVLTVPYLFVENFQSNEDYYVNFMIADFYRMLRTIAFFITTCVPAVYIAAVTVQQELLPTPLILSISVARQGIPFPSILEVLLMWLMFDILRQSGVRAASSIGQTLSIVGALVIGQAAVEARIFSAPVIIIIAVTGITSLILPRLLLGILWIRLVFLMLSFVFGLFGLLIGLMGLLIYLVDMRNYGILAFYVPKLSFQTHKDTFFRAPWYRMKTRPRGLSQDPVRKGPEGKADE